MTGPNGIVKPSSLLIAVLLIAGNAVFGSGDPKKNTEALLKAATEAALQKV